MTSEKSVGSGCRRSQFVVAVGHNISNVTDRLFVAKGQHRVARLSQNWVKPLKNILWPQRDFRKGYWVGVKAITVCCGCTSQHLKSDREAIRGQRPPQVCQIVSILS